MGPPETAFRVVRVVVCIGFFMVTTMGRGPGQCRVLNRCAAGDQKQNFPEGAAVSVPLRREGLSVRESFWWGQLSALVEPVAAVLGAAAIIYMTPILPYALSFAAGAMIFVVVEELVPEAHRGGNGDIATMGVMIGFAVMMVLDVAFG